MKPTTLTISAATITVTEDATTIDAIVNGELQTGWCFFAGTTNEHIDAAFDYLTNTVGLSCSDITFEDTTQPWQPDAEYAAGFAHACGYID